MPATPGGTTAGGTGTQTVTASYYRGSGGGSCGMGLGMTFAELDMGHALGGLKCGTNIRVTYQGKSIVVKKTDIGLGGPGLNGTRRAIDLYITAAQALGITGAGLAIVRVDILGSQGKPGRVRGGNGSGGGADSGADVNQIFTEYMALRDYPRNRPEYADFFTPTGPTTAGPAFIGASGGATPQDYVDFVAGGGLGGITSGGKQGKAFGKKQAQREGQSGLFPSISIPNPFSTIADAINSALDFLKFVAWIFHPVNIVRGVEFVTGMVLMFYGAQAHYQAYKEEARGGYRGSRGAARRSGIGRTAERIVEATPVGREVRMARGRRAGKRSARRQQYYREYDRSYRSSRRTVERSEARRSNRRNRSN